MFYFFRNAKNFLLKFTRTSVIAFDFQEALSFEGETGPYVQYAGVRARNILAHIRKATQGVVSLENCHPFVRELWGRYWVFAHNGNLVDFHPRLHGAFRPVGDTDSERAFCWLMQELAKAHAGVPAIDELSCTLAELMPRLHRHGTFNMLLSNGQALWAHCSTHLHWVERRHPFGAARLRDEINELKRELREVG